MKPSNSKNGIPVTIKYELTMHWLLQLKNWQAFLFIYIFPFFLGIAVIIAGRNNPIPVMTLTGFGIIVLLPRLFIVCWFYALGISLNKKLPEHLAMNPVLFKIMLPVPFLYSVWLWVSIFHVIKRILTHDAVSFFGAVFRLIKSTLMDGQFPHITLLRIIWIAHFVMLFITCYCNYFCAKELKTTQLQRPAKPGDFAGEFFLLFFFPIGIWFIQPAINECFKPILAVNNKE